NALFHVIVPRNLRYENYILYSEIGQVLFAQFLRKRTRQNYAGVDNGMSKISGGTLIGTMIAKIN
ncbi:MAG: hypothetical protein LBR61_00995, partial [Synergistaceae bacterium]|nr:hypothetical protein [Synergistaceae bacterium]